MWGDGILTDGDADGGHGYERGWGMVKEASLNGA